MRKLLSAAALIAALASSCSSSSPQTTDPFHIALRIAATDDPETLDPRLSRNLSGSTVMRMLYEGLTRIDAQGNIKPAAATSIEQSPDGLTYTFTLRETFWSDGTSLTASDFVETWRSILDPAFPSPNAYQLYVIKGAKAAKEGKAPLNTVGITATAPHTLVVELERPTPHFLELVSCHFFFPVSSSTRSLNATAPDKPHVNGPFQLVKWERRNIFCLERNPHYWDAANVSLPSITLYIMDENTALNLFKAKAIDWIGSPLSTLPQDTIAIQKAQGQLKVADAAGTHWFRLNTSKAPFDDPNMRKAFSLALDRQAIVDHITQGGQKPAFGIIPPSLGWTPSDKLPREDLAEARRLFDASLASQGKTLETLPTITLSYASGDRSHKIAQAVQQQWSKAFGVNIALENSEAQVLRERLSKGSYQIALGGWYADYLDPMNFLEIFKSKSNATNQTFWEDASYTALLGSYANESDENKRTQILVQAEEKLIDAMPVIPLFFNAYNYLKTDGIEQVYFSPLGYLDFKPARFASAVHEEK